MVWSALLLLIAAEGRHYIWNDDAPGQTVAYGVPDTDDRALRIDCVKGRLSISGPADADETERVQVRITSRAGARTFRSGVTEAGDGPNFTVAVTERDDALVTLLAGRPVTIAVKDDVWSVPGKGAAKVLAPLIKGCRARVPVEEH